MIQTAINAINSFLYNRLLIILLIGAGLYFTIRTKLPQIRLFGEACRAIMEKPEDKKKTGFSIERNLPVTLLLGAVTGAICSMSGAGGPVLVMPLLVVMGISVRTAVGVALFNSVFIGIPAVTGYLAQCDIKKLLPVLLIALLTHGVGVYFGSKNASRINQKLLKTGIAVFSVGIAVCKLTGIF